MLAQGISIHELSAACQRRDRGRQLPDSILARAAAASRSFAARPSSAACSRACRPAVPINNRALRKSQVKGLRAEPWRAPPKRLAPFDRPRRPPLSSTWNPIPTPAQVASTQWKSIEIKKKIGLGGAFLLTGCAAVALPRPAEAHPDSSIEVGGARRRGRGPTRGALCNTAICELGRGFPQRHSTQPPAPPKWEPRRARESVFLMNTAENGSPSSSRCQSAGRGRRTAICRARSPP